MKRLFRSIINIKKNNAPTIDQANLKANYRAFLASHVEPEEQSYIKLYHWIESHFREYDEIPAVEYLFEKAKKDGDESVLAIITEIVQQQPYIASDYRAILKEKFEEQNRDKFQSVLQKTWQVVDSGLKVGKKDIKGINSAIEYFVSQSRRYRLGLYKNKIEGNIRSIPDKDEVIAGYNSRKIDKYGSLGMYTFLDRIDAVCRGLKPGELMLIAGFTGHGKSIMSANLAYNGIMQGLNGLFVSMEMSYEEMRDMFYVLHTSNTDWLENPKYKNLCGKMEYDKLAYGEFTDLEQEFFQTASEDLVLPNRGYGELILYQPPERFTPSTLETVAYDYNASFQERGKSLDFIVLDYTGLMVVDKNEKYGDWNVDLNSIIKKLKNLALTFDSGRKIRVMSPFQVNRDGWKEAVKNDGVYRLSALSNANEAERSSDLVISVFMSDDMKKTGIVKICCLKHRKGAQFSPFDARMDLKTKHLRDIEIISKGDDKSDELIRDIPMEPES